MELLHPSLASGRWQTITLAERLREFICDELCNDERLYLAPRDLRKYFFMFALVARAGR